jgi:hypothetical protein
MELPNDIPTVMQNAGRYFMEHGNDIPEFQRNRIVELMGPGVSPVDYIVRLAETLYAVSDELDVEGKEIAAQAANLAAINGWHNMSERGLKIVNAIKRKKGEETIQAVEDDPNILESEIASTLENPEPMVNPVNNEDNPPEAAPKASRDRREE